MEDYIKDSAETATSSTVFPIKDFFAQTRNESQPTFSNHEP